MATRRGPHTSPPPALLVTSLRTMVDGEMCWHRRVLRILSLGTEIHLMMPMMETSRIWGMLNLQDRQAVVVGVGGVGVGVGVGIPASVVGVDVGVAACVALRVAAARIVPGGAQLSGPSQDVAEGVP